MIGAIIKGLLIVLYGFFMYALGKGWVTIWIRGW